MDAASSTIVQTPDTSSDCSSRQDICRLCGERCNIPLSASMPRHVVEAFERAGLSWMHTCEEGALVQHRALGVSYADVIDARIRESVAWRAARR
jgi:hypothetical protein